MARQPRTKGFAEVAAPFMAPEAPAHLADACALIVFFAQAGRGMSARGRAAMSGRLLVSPVAVWEITRKVSDGKLPPIHRADTADLLDFLTQRGCEAVPLTWEMAALANELPPHHRDPMDRLLIASAQVLRCPIITHDTAFAAYDVPLVW